MRVLLNVVGMLQHLVGVPGLLIFALYKFSDDEDGGGVRGGLRVGTGDGWVEKLSIVPWDNFLTFSTPMFQLCEGFCSLLVIQAVGQISRWLVNRNRSDTWMVWDIFLRESLLREVLMIWAGGFLRFHSWLCLVLSFPRPSTSFGE